jgi:hypothetical protein
MPGFELFSPVVGAMKICSVARRSHLVALVMAALASACAVSETGLGPTPDAGSAGTAVCPAGLTHQANWPAGTTYTSCTKPCGPDDIGIRSCGQTDRGTCQVAGGCVCLEAPCVTCADCAFLTISECYAPTNAASVPACSKEVTEGGACSQACDRQLCLEADGKTGCVCNAHGKYACATWGETTWK